MFVAFAYFHFLKINIIPRFVIFLVLLIIVQPLCFNITNFNDLKSAGIISYGDARIFDGSLVLNTFNEGTYGRVTYWQPLGLKDTLSELHTHFFTRFSFTIDGIFNATYGDGFAFYLAPLGYQFPVDHGMYLGLYEKLNGNEEPKNYIVAVEFDTFPNRGVDPPTKHVGINTNSALSYTTAFFDIDNNIGNQCHVLITYNAHTRILSVNWSFNGTSSGFMPKDSLSYKIDLAEVLPEWVTIGFSGATGTSTEKNIIDSWEFTSTLNSTDLKNTQNNSSIKRHYELKVVVAVAVTCSITIILVVASISWLLIKGRRTHGDGGEVNHRDSLAAFDLDGAGIPRRFDYAEMVAATNGFADDRKLGRGGSGQVYKGVLTNLGCVVAVKRIFADFENSERVFINEVKIISRLIHRNLVRFIGWCHEEKEFLLVFEYMPNVSLDTHLFGNRRSLAWDVRYKVALGVARALHYLHEDAEQCVLHRDIKSANVLLDSDFSTKLTDFGLAKLVDPRLRSQMTELAGTHGYMAPEYINEGRFSKKSDIYSFGVVALEIACGRRTYQDGEYRVPLTWWVWQQHLEGKILIVVDERLNGDFDEHEMTCLLIVGLWCTHSEDKERPTAEVVIKVLKQELPLPMLDMSVCPPHPTNGKPASLQSSPITSCLNNVGR